MNREIINRIIEAPTDADAFEALLGNRDTIVWVDWREEDIAIVEYCESRLQTGTLSAEDVDADNDAGFEMYIGYKNKRIRVPLQVGTEDRHITIVALNEILRPDFEIRFCIDSHGSDTLAFLPLSSEMWRELESRYGDAVGTRFYRLQSKPNLFTDVLLPGQLRERSAAE